jgi:hypothetical protein
MTVLSSWELQMPEGNNNDHTFENTAEIVCVGIAIVVALVVVMALYWPPFEW